jgi:hypothetical protein
LESAADQWVHKQYQKIPLTQVFCIIEDGV